jgi:hypothetical protein
MQRIPVPSFHTPSTTSPAVLELREHAGPARAQAEQFIRERFARCSGAPVDTFMPRLFSLRNREGLICGAFGLRSAMHTLALEQYLDRPIEVEIAARLGHSVDRHAIVEVGQFCGTYPGVLREAIELLAGRLNDEGFDWVALTATASLRNAFLRMGLSPLDLRPADGARLPASTRTAWGSHDDSVPRVLVGHVGGGHRALPLGRAQPARETQAAA